MIPRISNYGVWLILAIPAGATMIRYGVDSISYGKVLHETGQWSAGLVVLALLATPLRRMVGPRGWVRFLLAQRRAIGVASFAYAALHTLVYLERKAELARILAEGQNPSLLTGWLALAVFAILAATSNNTSVRRLGRNWKRLHRSVYVATGLMFAHWYLAAFNERPALVVGGLVLLTQVVRLMLGRR